METMRARAKDTVPNVLLTLLSIIQALALELLWSELRSAEYLFVSNWTAAIYWLQGAAAFCGVIVIWVVYATNVMRFRWVPGISDSVLPFFIGMVQFMMIERMGPSGVGGWLVMLAVVFGLMHYTAHTTLRRARLDGDNDFFFTGIAPAARRDFYPAIASVGALVAAGALIEWAGEPPSLALAAMLGTLGLFGWQTYVVAHFWNRSMSKLQTDA